MTTARKTARVSSLRTPSGIEIWHVEDYTVPLVSLEFAFMGGAAQDPEGQTGLTHLLSGLYDEGAGTMRAEDFKEALEDRAIELSFDSGRDRLDGSLRSISTEMDAAFDLLAASLNQPRFDADAIDRVKAQIVAGLKHKESDPGSRARDALYRRAFTGHSYRRPVDGVAGELATITREDLVRQHRNLVARANLHVVAVGAISPEKLIDGVERAFGPLPATPHLVALDNALLQGGGEREIIDLDIPQSTLYLALQGLRRDDPDFVPATVMNFILGGGMTSRLFIEVREKRGLAYSVWSSLAYKEHAQLFLCGTATSNERVAESLRIIEGELQRMVESGLSEDELVRAKSYMIGSYALRFDSSRKIANELLEIRIDKLGIDHIDRRNGYVEAVTLAQTQRAAERIFANAKPLIIAAGRPIGL